MQKRTRVCAQRTVNVHTVAYEMFHDHQIKSKSVYHENTRRKIRIKRQKK